MSFQSKIVIIIVLIVLSLFGIMNNAPAAEVDSDPLGKAMKTTGAQVEEVTINAWMKLPNTQFDDEQLVQLVEQVMAELGLNPLQYQLTREEKNQQYCVRAEAVNSIFHALVSGKRIQKEKLAIQTENYLIITIEDKTQENFFVPKMQEKIRQISKKNGSSPHISTCLIGWLNGTLRDGEQQDLLQKAFKAIDGTIIDKLEAGQFSSYTGFAVGIMEWLQVDGQKINLNMAMRYSQYDDRTYVTIGSPIITQEY